MESPWMVHGDDHQVVFDIRIPSSCILRFRIPSGVISGGQGFPDAFMDPWETRKANLELNSLTAFQCRIGIRVPWPCGPLRSAQSTVTLSSLLKLAITASYHWPSPGLGGPPAELHWWNSGIQFELPGLLVLRIASSMPTHRYR